MVFDGPGRDVSVWKEVVLRQGFCFNQTKKLEGT